MSLKDKVRSELGRQAQAGSGATPCSLRVSDGSRQVQLELSAIGPLGCAFNRMAYTSDAVRQASMDDLQQMASELEQRLSYLLEAISPIEVDEEECVIQMRSNPPAKDDDGTKYYELVVRCGEISLSRYNKPRGQPRDTIPAEVTHEVVARLAGDFEDTAR